MSICGVNVMEQYNFWQDFFDTYQSLSDGMKMLWLIVPSSFVLVFVALVIGKRPHGKQADDGCDGDLVYSVYRDGDDRLLIVAHQRKTAVRPFRLLLDPPNCNSPKPHDSSPRA